jgi:site-specific DNA recombinase
VAGPVPERQEASGTVTASDPGGGTDVLAAWGTASAARGSRSAGLRFAFYGRVSTEDWQDPVTSRARQYAQAAALVSGRDRITAEFFDSRESRTLPRPRRPQARVPRYS